MRTRTKDLILFALQTRSGQGESDIHNVNWAWMGTVLVKIAKFKDQKDGCKLTLNLEISPDMLEWYPLLQVGEWSRSGSFGCCVRDFGYKYLRATYKVETEGNKAEFSVRLLTKNQYDDFDRKPGFIRRDKSGGQPPPRRMEIKP